MCFLFLAACLCQSVLGWTNYYVVLSYSTLQTNTNNLGRESLEIRFTVLAWRHYQHCVQFKCTEVQFPAERCELPGRRTELQCEERVKVTEAYKAGR